MWRWEIWGPGRGVRHEGGAPARPGAGGCGLWPVTGSMRVEVPGGNGEREGGR
jgi:hypothetical protein